MHKKILASLLLFSFLFVNLLISPLSQAKAQWYNQDFVEWYAHVYDDSNPEEIFGERYTAAQVDWIIMSFLTWPTTKFVGPDGTKCFLEAIIEGSAEVDSCIAMSSNLIDIIKRLDEAVGKIREEAKSDSAAPGGQNATLLGQIFKDRPLSGIFYIKNLGRNFSLTPQVHAQQAGFGYSRLGGITQKLWNVSRDFSYAVFVVVAIIFAFMIMFRVKISPQVVISVQSTLPKLFVALILVTFSYAIAGLMVDLMYVVIGIISLILGPITANAIPDFFMRGGDDVALTFSFLTEGILGAGVFGFLIFDLFAYTIVFLLAITALPEGIIGNLLLLGPSSAIAIIVAVLAFIILIFVLLFMLFKITWMLIKTTAQILLLVMIAPVQITLGTVVPGIGFGSWIKSLAANLAVFPTAGFLFTISYIFLAEAFNAAVKGLPFLGGVSDLLGISKHTGANFGDGWPPLLGAAGDPAPLILLSVSLVFLFMIPKAAEIIKGIISGRPFAYGSAIGEAFGPAKVVGMGGMQYVSSEEASIYEKAKAAGKLTEPVIKRHARYDVLRRLGVVK